MPSGNGAELPDVTDADIRRVSRLLGLVEHAFFGPTGSDPRLSALKRMDTFDVAACPGSGKTTLLVAKLAILSEKWPHRTRGICVLSHTNAARHEIETRLGGTPAGRALLSYPHFVGTIHGFTNEFLALPWLRSNGYRGIRFDDDISGDRLERALHTNRAVESYLEKNFRRESDRSRAIRSASYGGQDLDIVVRAGSSTKRLLRSSNSSAFQRINSAKKRVLDAGFACYADAFGFAARAMRDSAWLADVLCTRFPAVFLDEAQDTDEVQADLLHAVFRARERGSELQRFGDANQAIYGSNGDVEPTTITFPNVGVFIDLPSSHRFGPGIAALARPLGVTAQQLDGLGPPKLPDPVLREPKHTIFLFDTATAGTVLDAYGALLVRTFPASVLHTGHFAAVGAVHKEDENAEATKSDHFPKRICDYWSGYAWNLSGAEPKPDSFVQFLGVARSRADRLSHSSPAVETIAEGVLRLVELSGGKRIARKQRRHRHVLELLEQAGSGLTEYQDLLRKFAIERASVESAAWCNVWKPRVLELAEVMAGPCRNPTDTEAFLRWSDTGNVELQPRNATRRDNVYVYREQAAEVSIHVGSIHSVKGQTHTATLVLETFNRTHHLQQLVDWLIGKRVGRRKGSNDAELQRLRMHYVAMTRPTHLLCLAMKRSSFEQKPGFDANTAELKARGWQVHDLTQEQVNASPAPMEPDQQGIASKPAPAPSGPIPESR